LKNPGHPFKKDHAFIKRFSLPRESEEEIAEMAEIAEIPEEETDTDQIKKIEELINNGDFKDARKIADKIIESYTNSQIYLDLCKLFYNEGILDHTVELCKRGIERYKDCGELYEFLGKALYDGNPHHAAEAMAALSKAKELGCTAPEPDELLRDLGNIKEVKELLNNEKFDNARQIANKVTSSCPNYQVYLSLCNLFHEAGLSGDAVELCKPGIKQHENCWQLYAFLGKALYDGNPNHAAEAMAALRKAKELGSMSPELDELLDDLEKIEITHKLKSSSR
jgi:tetratricopeptide (TPR) repeat protein